MVSKSCKGQIKSYTSAVALTEDTWKCSDKKQKTELLKAIKVNTSWAKTKSIEEMVKRGGGMVAKDIKKLNEMFLSEKGGRVTITWT